jgi:DNA invertase Pin-like site-specific DNA recombinase
MALAALEKMRPFLIVKADEADIAMAYQRRVMTWNGEDKEAEYAARMAMSREAAAIKQRAYEGVELPKTERRSYDHSGPRLRMKVNPPKAKHVKVKVAVPVRSTGYDRKKRPVDAADIGILRGIYEDHGLAEVALEYGVSRQTILNWLDRYGIPRQGRTVESEARRKAAAAASWKE